MKIKFLGTAAAEGIPALYCQCDICKDAWIHKGKNIRTRAQALIDDKILIDFGPDTYAHVLQYEVPLDTIHHVLITHKHSDHFYPADLLFRRPGYASKVEEEPLHVYGCEPALYYGSSRSCKAAEKYLPGICQFAGCRCRSRKEYYVYSKSGSRAF